MFKWNILNSKLFSFAFKKVENSGKIIKMCKNRWQINIFFEPNKVILFIWLNQNILNGKRNPWIIFFIQLEKFRHEGVNWIAVNCRRACICPLFCIMCLFKRVACYSRQTKTIRFFCPFLITLFSSAHAAHWSCPAAAESEWESWRVVQWNLQLIRQIRFSLRWHNAMQHDHIF